MKFIAAFFLISASFTAFAQTKASVSCEYRVITSSCGSYNFPCPAPGMPSSSSEVVRCKVQQMATVSTVASVQKKLAAILNRVDWPKYNKPTISCDNVGVADDVAKCEGRISVRAYTGYDVSQEMTEAILRELN